MNEAVLTEIITRLLASPELQALLQPNTEICERRPGCLILVNSQQDLERLPTLTARYHPDYSLQVCALSSIEVPGKQINRISWEQAVEQPSWSRIHLPVCSADQLAQIALGLISDKVGRMIAWAISQGIPVEIGQLNLGFTAKTPDSYRQMFAEYVRRVTGFGVVIAGSNSETQATPAVQPVPMVPGSPEPLVQPLNSGIRYEKRLLSAKEALQFPLKGIIRIAKTTVVAPGAIDVLKKQKIEVYREGVRCC
ncbi:hypothetical protein [Sporomusa acidovorans]|uniref:Ethanolamine utilization protein n=1 Tax=Sporomusa acidovorans (strain ATCC 49682 / DSM 3132 / Mol) TaxID=1123286 RepID=A0ABZ3J9G5_SPOA4|nr:hypothetical protein [Sporomusa acidovorans]OZC17510.1 hypothetical protein SPACI_37560 [Sporomusa acidovorans DSM 3132]SDF07989.1 hypothetical protein SAMN04488499_103225 [Sporomusa acidovorans]